LRRRERLERRPGSLADEAQFGVDQLVEFRAHTLQVGPQALLDLQAALVQADGELTVLGAHGLAIVAVHQGEAVLECSVQVGCSAQELHLVGRQLLLPTHAPLGPMIANVGQLLASTALAFLHFFEAGHSGGDMFAQLLIQLITAGAFGGNLFAEPLFQFFAADVLCFVQLFAEAALGGKAVAELHQSAVGLVQRLDGSVYAGDGLAVKLHLLSHVPVEDPRHESLPRLDQAVERSAGARVDGPYGRHFAQRGIARMYQTDQVGQRYIRCAGRSLGVAGTDAVAHVAQNSDQFSAFHFFASIRPSPRCRVRRAGRNRRSPWPIPGRPIAPRRRSTRFTMFS
jgi:hypothetical protein